MSVAYLRDLVTDASAEATAPGGLRERATAYGARVGDVLGPLLVRDDELPEVAAAVEGAGTPLSVTIAVTGGAGAIEPAVRWATRQSGIRFAGLVATVRDLDDLARGAHRVAAMVAQLDDEGLLDDVVVEVALPLYARVQGASRWQHALDTLAMEDLRLVLRTGGADADDVPTPETLAGAIGDALDREVAFSCGGGLSHAVARTGEHGILNLLLATRASLDGEPVDVVAERLTQTDAEQVVAALDAAGEPALESARRWLTGVGSYDVDATLADLRALALL